MSWQCACSIVGGPLHTHTPWPHTSTSSTAHPNIHSKIACLSWRIQCTLHGYVCTFMLCCLCSSVASTSWDTFPSQPICASFFAWLGPTMKDAPTSDGFYSPPFFIFFQFHYVVRTMLLYVQCTWWTIYVSIRIVSETVCLQNLRNGWNSVSTVQCFSQFFLCSWIAFIYSYSI